MKRNGDQSAASPACASLGGFADFDAKPRKACVVWLRAEWRRLCDHLHNCNDERRFVIAFNNAKGTHYARNKSKRLEQAVSWAWDTITGRAKSPLAFVPYSQNERGESRWGAIDFDAHDGNRERARDFAQKAFRVLRGEPGVFVILETTGDSGGWHVWAIAREFHPLDVWTRLLRDVCATIGAEVRASICEIYPPDTERSEYGRGVRAPGCWNPKGGFSEIVFENCAELLRTEDGLQPPIGELDANDLSGNSHGETNFEFPEKRKKYSFSPSLSSIQNGGAVSEHPDAQLYSEWLRKWCKDFAITIKGTRNAQLGSLAGTIFYQVGHGMAKRIAREQFQTKTAETKAGLREHIKDFAHYWQGMGKKWREGLSKAERSALDSLNTDNERDAFRIVKNFTRLAAMESREDFPIACENLAARLGITGRGAAKLRARLAEFGIIKLVQAYRANSKAARSVWTVGSIQGSREKVGITLKRCEQPREGKPELTGINQKQPENEGVKKRQ